MKPAGVIAIAGAGLTREIEGPAPDHLKVWWERGPVLWCLRSATWWRRHWERTGMVDVELADTMPRGWQLSVEWQRLMAPRIDSRFGLWNLIGATTLATSGRSVADGQVSNWMIRSSPCLRNTLTGAARPASIQLWWFVADEVVEPARSGDRAGSPADRRSRSCAPVVSEEEHE